MVNNSENKHENKNAQSNFFLEFCQVIRKYYNLIWFFIAASTSTYACGQKTEGSISDSLGSLGSIFEDGCKKHENKVCKNIFFSKFN